MPYKIALICHNGHCINPRFDESSPKSAFCSLCGSITITECPECNSLIRGFTDNPRIIDHNYKVPAYCYNCGNPYPWTEKILAAAQALIEEEEDASTEEKNKMIEVLPDIITKTPQTALAVSRFRRFTSKAGTFTMEIAKELFISVASEVAKRALGW